MSGTAEAEAEAAGLDLAPATRSRARPAVVDQVLGCALLGLLFLASTAPSPLYRLYQEEWHFSSAMLTVVFAVYSGPVILALHFCGPLSDRYGRRRLAVIGFTIVLASLLVFIFAKGLWWLFAARALQGFGVGTTSAALTASVINARRRTETGGATTIAMVSSNVGVGIGALVSGFFVQYVVDPTMSVFVALSCACAVAIVACTRISPARSNHVDRVSWLSGWKVPRAARPAVAVYLMGMALAWALAGLYLSLGPSIAQSLGGRDGLVGGLVAAILGFGGALAAGASRGWSERHQVQAGLPLLVVGLVGVVIACAATSSGIFLGGSAVLALGWGLVYIGTFRSLVALSSPESRGAAVSVIYLLTYVAFSLPAIVAGVCTDAFGLRHTTIAFGSIAATLSAGVGLVLFVDRGRTIRTRPAGGSRRTEDERITPEGRARGGMS